MDSREFGFESDDLGLEDLPETQLMQLNGGAKSGAAKVPSVPSVPSLPSMPS